MLDNYKEMLLKERCICAMGISSSRSSPTGPIPRGFISIWIEPLISVARSPYLYVTSEHRVSPYSPTFSPKFYSFSFLSFFSPRLPRRSSVTLFRSLRITIIGYPRPGEKVKRIRSKHLTSA